MGTFIFIEDFEDLRDLAEHLSHVIPLDAVLADEVARENLQDCLRMLMDGCGCGRMTDVSSIISEMKEIIYGACEEYALEMLI